MRILYPVTEANVFYEDGFTSIVIPVMHIPENAGESARFMVGYAITITLTGLDTARLQVTVYCSVVAPVFYGEYRVRMFKGSIPNLDVIRTRSAGIMPGGPWNETFYSDRWTKGEIYNIYMRLGVEPTVNVPGPYPVY